jgi:hypothetical protein
MMASGNNATIHERTRRTVTPDLVPASDRRVAGKAHTHHDGVHARHRDAPTGTDKPGAWPRSPTP